jgi:general secretion pathway protein A
MYTSFYGLKRNPFDISPDPNFFCPTPRHNEALASLVYGIKQRKGFIVITGEVGTGKTLLAQCLFTFLKRSKIQFGYVFNTRLSALDFLQYVMADLGLPAKGKSKGEMLVEFNNYLIERYRQQSTVALIVDEAQLLDWDLLEEIRLLTNLETPEHKLLQIVLMGQPEFDNRLESANLRQLKQRIAFRCRLEPLSEAHTREYVRRRMRLAGATQAVLGDDAISAVHRYSRGIPRLINTICEHVLISGYASRNPIITPEMIDEVADDLRLEPGRQTARKELAATHG